MKDISNSNVIYYNQNDVAYLQFKKLLQYPEIKHCYTMRPLNFPPISKDEKTLKQNFNIMANELKVDVNKIVKPHQTHTDHVEVVNQVEEFDQVDGLLTNQKGITLCTTSADCISLLFYDPIKKVIGSVHSGWKGTLQGISKKAVERMMQEYQSNTKDIICCICPSIRQCCFEVDEDVKELFYQKYKRLESIYQIIQNGPIKEGKQKYYIDTVKINQELLKQTGLKEENIIDSKICTKCNASQFHSYRAEKENSGRNAAMISLSVLGRTYY